MLIRELIYLGMEGPSRMIHTPQAENKVNAQKPKQRHRFKEPQFYFLKKLFHWESALKIGH